MPPITSLRVPKKNPCLTYKFCLAGKGDEDQGRGQSIPVTEAMLSTLPASGPDSSAISNGVTANYRSCDPSSSHLPEGCILDKLLRLQKQSEMDEREAQALRDRLLARVKTTAEQLHQVPGHGGMPLWHPRLFILQT